MGILAKHTPYLENKTLLICNFLEILRYNYAINIRHFIQKKGYIYLSDGRTRINFNEIIEDFCQENNLKGWIAHYTNIRNEIVNQREVIGNDFMEKRQNYLKLHHFCDRVILTLLNWDHVSGYYIPIHRVNRQTRYGIQVNRIKFKR